MANQALFDVLTVPRVQKIYADDGTNDRKPVSVFGAQLDSIPEGAYMIGHVAVPEHVNNIPTSSVVLVKPLVEKDESGDPVFMAPLGYEQIWNDQHTGGTLNGSFWRVEPPFGYVALGDVACDGYDQPSSEFTAKYACIRRDLLSEGVVDSTSLWTDQGSGAQMSVSIWKVDGDGLGGLFIAHSRYDKPARQVFVLPVKVTK